MLERQFKWHLVFAEWKIIPHQVISLIILETF